MSRPNSSDNVQTSYEKTHPVTLGAVLYGVPYTVSQGKLVPGEGHDKEQLIDPNKMANIELPHLAQNRKNQGCHLKPDQGGELTNK